MRRIHTESKIFFKESYVCRVRFPLAQYEYIAAVAEFSKTRKRLYNVTGNTWGHSKIYSENIREFSFDKMNEACVEYRGYICFSNELDVLQFLLGAKDNVQRVSVWPDRVTFTIHEVLPDNES